MKIVNALLFSWLMLLFHPLMAQKIPDDAVARLVDYGHNYIKALNDTSTVFRIRTAGEIFSEATIKKAGIDRLINQMGRLSNDFSPLEYHHTEVTGTSLHVFARATGNQQWHDFQFYTEKEPPFKIKELVFIAQVAEPVYLPNGSIDSPMVIEWLENYIDKLRKENDLTVSLLIAKGASPIFEKYVGFADAAGTRKVDSATRFNLGSGNKMFTALAVMQLASVGKLQLNDPIAKYFPDFPDTDFARKATIHNLLSHTSGLGDYWTDDYEKSWDKISRLSDVLPFVYADSTYFEPGEKFLYSNSGFLLAGLIVEKVSGEDYFDYVRNHIYDPLKMANTDSYFRDDTTANLADPLSPADSGWVVARHGRRGTSAGGGYSTPRDMLRFIKGLNAGEIISRTYLDQMLQPHNAGLEEHYVYGYGFILNRSQSGIFSYGHGGIAPGINFELRYFPDLDITLIMFCNQDNGAYDDLRKNIVKLITGDR